MSAYPTKLRIGDRVYKIRMVKCIRKDVNTLGLFDPARIEILIKSGQSSDETLKTLLHEIFHGFEYEYEVTVKHKDIYKLEEALFDFLSANSESLFIK